MISNNNTQIFGYFAACQISGDGLVKKAFGCDVARVSLGVYDITLPEGSGLSAEESYLQVTPRQAEIPIVAVGVPTVVNLDAFTKRVTMTGIGDVLGDQGFTAVLFRSPFAL